jgi:large subunit ribosomal protein L10
MDRAQKEAVVAQLNEELGMAASILLTDLSGMDVESINGLRAELRQAGVSYRVAKNTLIKRAIAGTDVEVLSPMLVGPTAMAWHNEEPSLAAKIVKDFVKDNDKFTIKGGYIDGETLEGEGALETLAEMPSKDELRAKTLGLMKMVPGKFLALIETAPKKFFAALLVYEDKQKEGGE